MTHIYSGCVFWVIFGTLSTFQEGYFDGFFGEKLTLQNLEITFSLDPKCSTCKMFSRRWISNSQLFLQKGDGQGVLQVPIVFCLNSLLSSEYGVFIFRKTCRRAVGPNDSKAETYTTECRGGNVPIQTRPIVGDVHMITKRENGASFCTKWGDFVVGKMIYWTFRKDLFDAGVFFWMQVVLNFSKMVIFVTGKAVWRNPRSCVLLVPKHP